MQKYKTMTDFSGEGVMPMLSAIVTAIPPFFSITLFVIWVFGTGSSYFIMLKTTGKKRFWHALTGMSFAMFIVSLSIAAMNTTEITFLNGYWVGFYMLMTLMAYVLLGRYK